jgi:hypothetical protein
MRGSFYLSISVQHGLPSQISIGPGPGVTPKFSAYPD